jgi:hypothetical protein
MKTNTEDSPRENRRSVLKKAGAAGAFVIPAVASFTLTELKVRASGLPQTEIETNWTTYWSSHNSFWGSTAVQWSVMKETWFSIFKAFGAHD